MEDVTELLARVSQELGPQASDEEVSEKLREVIAALPESDRAQVLDQLVKGIGSGQLRHLEKEMDAHHRAGAGESAPGPETTP